MIPARRTGEASKAKLAQKERPEVAKIDDFRAIA